MRSLPLHDTLLKGRDPTLALAEERVWLPMYPVKACRASLLPKLEDLGSKSRTPSLLRHFLQKNIASWGILEAQGLSMGNLEEDLQNKLEP